MSSKQGKLTASAPGRAGIIGNPSDMYGGSVLACSLPMRAWAILTPASGLTLVTDGQECEIGNWDDLRPAGDLFDIAKAVLRYIQPRPLACRIEYGSDIPRHSGMAGSTALMVALLNVLLTWQGRRLGRYQLAEMARYIELNHLRVVCGYQDAYMTTFGGLNYLDFRGKQFYRRAEAELFATVESLNPFVEQLPFVLAYTGVAHSSGAVHKPIRERWLEGEQEVVAAYDRISELARMGKKAILQGDWRELGQLMNENHRIQRDVGGSGLSNERLIEAALDGGALGAKLAGAGDGGTIIALFPNLDDQALELALMAAGAEAIYHLALSEGTTVTEEDI
ncbi:MAG: galactokinase family protein [Chloroflexota bacterium]|nr:galactokinase family protein [Chloroflexota bacterium]